MRGPCVQAHDTFRVEPHQLICNLFPRVCHARVKTQAEVTPQVSLRQRLQPLHRPTTAAGKHSLPAYAGWGLA